MSRTYRVQSGDNLWNIARDQGVSFADLKEANAYLQSRTPPYSLLPGDSLTIPVDAVPPASETTDTALAEGPEPSPVAESATESTPETSVATCTQSIRIYLKEPNVIDTRFGTVGDHNTGFRWVGVPGIQAEISGGGKTFSAESNGSGEVSFHDVPCGVYSLKLAQEEFSIAPFSNVVLAVNSSNKEFEILLKRQIKTIEIFRLGTQLLAAAGITEGVRDEDGQVVDTYGHWWTKIYATEADTRNETPRESYGWWPVQGAIGAGGTTKRDAIYDTIGGVPGELNGVSYGGTATTDPYHGKSRDYSVLEDVFFPFVSNGRSAEWYKRTVAHKAASFSADVSTEWSWVTDSGGWHCKTFQKYLMRHARLWKRIGARVWSRGWSTGTT